MASIIDNRKKTMLDSLRNSLKQAESVDILTAFFYFSGFNALAEELKDKKIRILVGNTIDPEAVDDLCRAVKDSFDESLETYAVRGYSRFNNSQKKLHILIVLSACSINQHWLKNLIQQTARPSLRCFWERLKMVR